jgi:hypothetical protein
MSIAHVNWVWENSEAEGLARLVLLNLADSMGRDTGECYPGVKRIAKECKVAERTVQRSLAHLEAIGEIKIIKNGSKYGTNIYSLIMEKGGANESPRQAVTGDNDLPGGDNTGKKVVTPLSPKQVDQPEEIKPEESSASAEEPESNGDKASKPKRQIKFFEELFEPKQLQHEKFMEAWRDFVQMRFDKGKKNEVTFVAAKRLIKEIKEHRDPIGLLDMSIAGGWLSLVPDAYDRKYGNTGIKPRNGAPRQQSHHEERIRNQSSGTNFDEYREHAEASRKGYTASG